MRRLYFLRDIYFISPNVIRDPRFYLGPVMPLHKKQRRESRSMITIHADDGYSLQLTTTEVEFAPFVATALGDISGDAAQSRTVKLPFVTAAMLDLVGKYCRGAAVERGCGSGGGQPAWFAHFEKVEVC